MHQFWVTLWTATWFVGVGGFAVLSVFVILFGGYDLVAMLTSLRARHLAAQEAEGQTNGSA